MGKPEPRGGEKGYKVVRPITRKGVPAGSCGMKWDPPGGEREMRTCSKAA